MSVIAAKQKLEEANLGHVSWLNPEHLQFNPTFLSSSPEELNIFVSWTAQQALLVNFLENGKLNQPYTDSLQLSKHAKYESYKVFITALLYPILKEKAKTPLNFTGAHNLLSISVLLTEREQDLIHDEVNVWLENVRASIKTAISQARSDQAIYTVLESELPAEFWKVLNAFNARHYRVKTTWLELLIGTVSHKHASARLLNFVIGRLELLELHDEHKMEIADLKKQLQKGKVSFEKTRIPWKKAILLTLVILIVAAGLVGIWFIPAKPEPLVVQEDTSFMELTPEERGKIDSLITSVKQEEVRKMQQGLDSNLPEPTAELVTRNTNSNAVFWEYYTGWNGLKPVDYAKSFSLSKKESRILPKTKAISKSTGATTLGFFNDSKLTALVILFDDYEGTTYTRFVAAGEQLKFNCKEGMQLLVLPGSDCSSNMNSNHLPYNQINEYFFRELETIYTVNGGARSMKLVLEDFSTNGTILVDLDGALSL